MVVILNGCYNLIFVSKLIEIPLIWNVWGWFSQIGSLKFSHFDTVGNYWKKFFFFNLTTLYLKNDNSSQQNSSLISLMLLSCLLRLLWDTLYLLILCYINYNNFTHIFPNRTDCEYFQIDMDYTVDFQLSSLWNVLCSYNLLSSLCTSKKSCNQL